MDTCALKFCLVSTAHIEVARKISSGLNLQAWTVLWPQQPTGGSTRNASRYVVSDRGVSLTPTSAAGPSFLLWPFLNLACPALFCLYRPSFGSPACTYSSDRSSSSSRTVSPRRRSSFLILADDDDDGGGDDGGSGVVVVVVVDGTAEAAAAVAEQATSAK